MAKSITRIASLATALALAVPVWAEAQAIPRTSSGTSSGGGTSSGSSGSSGGGGGLGSGSSSGGSSSSGSSSSGSSGGGEMTKAPSYPDLRSGGGEGREARSSSPKGSIAAGTGPAPGGLSTISGSGKSSSRSESSAGGVSVRTNPGSGGATDPITGEFLAGRARGERPVSATAVPRPPGSGIGGGGDYVSFPFYGPWGPWYPWYGVGFGAAFVAYNPWGYGATCWGWNPYGAWYNPYSYCWNPYWAAPVYGGEYGGGAARASKPAETTGSIRLKANPASAKVYIDGALAGLVDEFDGLNDHLEIEGGRHKLELRADGYVTHSEDINVAIGKTQTVRISLKKVKK